MRNIFLAVLLCLAVQTWAQTKPRESLDPVVTEIWEPEPKKVSSGTACGMPPSDAISLFDGTDLRNWINSSGGEAMWEVKDGIMTVSNGAGGIKSRQHFDDIQLHLEWRSPTEVRGEGQGRGNSGVYLQERYEIQVLDSYENKTYANGQAGAIYKQAIPLVNPSRKPGEWQSFDILYTAPRFSESGSLIIPAHVTVLHNGLVIHNHVTIQGQTQDKGLPTYKAHGKASILLQDHGDAVSYRNVWVRAL